MFKLFVLCFAILSLTCAVQCTPTAVKRDQPSLKPEVHAARGHCDFQCPHENVVGKELSKSYADSGRLYCRYDVEELDNKAFCMYKRVSLGFSHQKIPPFRDAYLHRSRRTPGNC